MNSISLGGAVAKRREQRLADLYWRHSADALRLALLLTGDRHAAEDIVQDAFVRLFGRSLELRSPDAFETYLRRTIINLSRDRFRKMRLERDHGARAVTPSSPAAATTQIEDREQIRGALLDLPHRQRAALILRFYVDLSEQQTADLLHCSVPAVKSLIARSTGTLKQRMRGDQL